MNQETLTSTIEWLEQLLLWAPDGLRDSDEQEIEDLIEELRKNLNKTTT